MGDRRNIIVTEKVGRPGVAIYTHWRGSAAPAELALALDSYEARHRYGDVGYLTRIIFDRLSVSDHLGETDWGLYPSIDGMSSPMEDFPGYDLIVETETQRILRVDKPSFGFEEFIADPSIVRESADADW